MSYAPSVYAKTPKPEEAVPLPVRVAPLKTEVPSPHDWGRSEAGTEYLGFGGVAGTETGTVSREERRIFHDRNS